MASKKFDVDVVLDQAVAVFWLNGYYGTSMQQLQDATGLRPGSLYREFENKEKLYQRALSRYAQQTIQNINQVIDKHAQVLVGIKTILEDLIEQSRAKDYCGCFLIKSQLELSSHSESISAYVSSEFAKIEANYEAHLTAIYSAEKSLLYAKQLMLVVYGIRVYSYQQQSYQSTESAALSLLPWLSNQQVIVY